MPGVRWTKVQAPLLPRSSHSLSVIGNQAFVFGGEIEPRKPVDNAMHVIDLESGKYTVLTPEGKAPAARVGHTSAVIGSIIYVFGGRGGAEMTPLDEAGAVWSFSTSDFRWTRLDPPADTPYPAPRSYHSMTSTPHSLIVHAGCPPSGRLRDTWEFSLSTLTWTQLPDAPGDERGGPGLCRTATSLFRFGGYNGKHEIGDLDILDCREETVGEWATAAKATQSPGARSVCGFHAVDDRLVLLFGEGKPSPTGGHDAAGTFWDDVWVYDTTTKTWEMAEQHGDKLQERGWFASDVWGDKVVVWGGIDSANQRLGDGWIMSFV